jgi:hypothetical protein
VFLYASDASLSDNIVVGNTASRGETGYGGGLDLYESAAILRHNVVQDNVASTADWGRGGGVNVTYSDGAILSGNRVQSNTASMAGRGYGGGVRLYRSDAAFDGNVMEGNLASTSQGFGGALCLSESSASLNANRIVSNTAGAGSTGYGGGVVEFLSVFTATNTLMANNDARTAGGALWVHGAPRTPAQSAGYLRHSTIADNLGEGAAVHVEGAASLVFTNAIVAGHPSVGITVTAGSTVALAATLWHGNGEESGGGGAITRTADFEGDPAFVDPDSGDYHIGPDSAALDRGLDAGVITDIDHEPRLNGEPDLGADEYWPPGVLRRVYLPLTLR